MNLITKVALSATLLFTTNAWAVPQVGRAMPSFSVSDLNETPRTRRDLSGQWTVVLAMSDKDAGDAVTAWCTRLRAAVPSARIVTMAALDLFPMIPSATIRSQARDSTPRPRWSEVWLSRDGSLAESLALPESETPWVFVIDPSGQVSVTIHSLVDPTGVARVAGALRPPQGAAPSP